MSKDRTTDFTLPKFDDLFSSQEERENGKMPEIKDIPLSLLDEFPNHPFKVKDDEDMLKLIESVSERGVLVPAIVRPKADGRYELLSGHRRKRASEYAGKNNMRCIVSNIDDDAATIIMVDSNIQREHILPSEKAFAYKMKLDAMNHQGQRTDLTFSQVGTKLNSAMELAENTGDSKTQIYRYIRLTYLVPELLEMVDEGRMKMSPAVEISYLDEDCQRDLVDAIDEEDCTPSHAQAIRLHKEFNENTLTREGIYSVMQEEKPNQKPKITIQAEKINKYLPKNVKREQTENFICKALEYYSKYLERQKMREAR
ncbi:MAG: ParB/RepB/Spo0J family partition protein [Eubacterium sp.]